MEFDELLVMDEFDLIDICLLLEFYVVVVEKVFGVGKYVFCEKLLMVDEVFLE